MFFLIAGVLALNFGVLSVTTFFAPDSVTLLSIILIISSLLCLVGVCIPNLWPLEMIGMSVTLGVVVIHFTSLFVVLAQGDTNKGIAFGLSGVAISIICWRISLLGNEWQIRHLEKSRG